MATTPQDVLQVPLYDLEKISLSRLQTQLGHFIAQLLDSNDIARIDNGIGGPTSLGISVGTSVHTLGYEMGFTPDPTQPGGPTLGNAVKAGTVTFAAVAPTLVVTTGLVIGVLLVLWKFQSIAAHNAQLREKVSDLLRIFSEVANILIAMRSVNMSDNIDNEFLNELEKSLTYTLSFIINHSTREEYSEIMTSIYGNNKKSEGPHKGGRIDVGVSGIPDVIGVPVGKNGDTPSNHVSTHMGTNPVAANAVAANDANPVSKNPGNAANPVAANAFYVTEQPTLVTAEPVNHGKVFEPVEIHENIDTTSLIELNMEKIVESANIISEQYSDCCNCCNTDEVEVSENEQEGGGIFHISAGITHDERINYHQYRSNAIVLQLLGKMDLSDLSNLSDLSVVDETKRTVHTNTINTNTINTIHTIFQFFEHNTAVDKYISHFTEHLDIESETHHKKWEYIANKKRATDIAAWNPGRRNTYEATDFFDRIKQCISGKCIGSANTGLVAPDASNNIIQGVIDNLETDYRQGGNSNLLNNILENMRLLNNYYVAQMVIPGDKDTKNPADQDYINKNTTLFNEMNAKIVHILHIYYPIIFQYTAHKIKSATTNASFNFNAHTDYIKNIQHVDNLQKIIKRTIPVIKSRVSSKGEFINIINNVAMERFYSFNFTTLISTPGRDMFNSKDESNVLTYTLAKLNTWLTISYIKFNLQVQKTLASAATFVDHKKLLSEFDNVTDVLSIYTPNNHYTRYNDDKFIKYNSGLKILMENKETIKHYINRISEFTGENLHMCDASSFSTSHRVMGMLKKKRTKCGGYDAMRIYLVQKRQELENILNLINAHYNTIASLFPDDPDNDNVDNAKIGEISKYNELFNETDSNQKQFDNEVSSEVSSAGKVIIKHNGNDDSDMKAKFNALIEENTVEYIKIKNTVDKLSKENPEPSMFPAGFANVKGGLNNILNKLLNFKQNKVSPLPKVAQSPLPSSKVAPLSKGDGIAALNGGSRYKTPNNRRRNAKGTNKKTMKRKK